MSSEGTSSDALATTLLKGLDCSHLMIEDVSACGCGQKFNLYACSKAFDGVALLDRHRKVQDILAAGTIPSICLCLNVITNFLK